MVDYLRKAWPDHPLRVVLLPLLLLALLLVSVPLVQAAEPTKTGYQGADYWRDVTQGKGGYSTDKAVEAGVLINRSGEEWRLTRNEQVKPYGAWLLTATLVALAAIFLLMGRSRIKAGRAGRTIRRWDYLDRLLHWLVAGLFIILALTGLCILYGRHFLPDVMGGGFGAFMQGAKVAHNYLGPLFLICLAAMLLKWIGRNLFNAVDLRWFLKLGGAFGGHPQAGYMNGGEKLWYWVLFLGGAVICVTGVILDFPGFGLVRDTMQDANLLHGGVSLLLICAALAHAYMGSLGTEGALEGMISGDVDENWAKQHHDLWYEEVVGKRGDPGR